MDAGKDQAGAWSDVSSAQTKAEDAMYKNVIKSQRNLIYPINTQNASVQGIYNNYIT